MNVGQVDKGMTLVGKAKDDGVKNTLQNAFDKKDDKELREACRGFETMFMSMLYKEMRATVQKSELVQEDAGKQTFESMLDDEMASRSSKDKGMGLGEMLYKQMSRQRNNTFKPPSQTDI